MNKLRVIDLFNDYSNDKELPEKIKYNGEIYFLDDGNYSTYNKYGYLERFFQWEWSFFEHLNDEVEIIEEDKKIEKLDTKDLFICDDYQNIRLNFGLTWSKINEIIDKINKEDE